MQRLFSGFPSGAAGCGLLILRACVAESVVALALVHAGTLGSSPALALIAWVAASLCLGFWTPLCCLLAITAQLAFFVAQGTLPPMEMAIPILHAIALMLLGPGAYSVDGRRYGRRVVILPGQDR